MRVYEELSADEKKQALNIFVEKLVHDIVSGYVRFNDSLNEDDFQSRIDKVIEKAERLRTPWFAGEMLLENSYIKELIEGMAICDAEDSYYPDKNEQVPTYIRL